MLFRPQRRWTTAVAVITLCACGSLRQAPFDATLKGREVYLCCNMHFNAEREASDSNYNRQRLPALAAGTRLRVVDVGASQVTFQPLDEPMSSYRLEFSFGREQQTAGQYFAKIFLSSDPTAKMAGLPGEIQEAIRQGQLINGMTKEQVLLARGYPPAHQTPELTRSDDWVYYQTPMFVDRVHFVDGKVQQITVTSAP